MRDCELPKTFYSVQVLRGVGALLVLLFHACSILHHNVNPAIPLFTAGAAGLDLFFVISGFIMIVTTRHYGNDPRASRIFLTRRLIRIVPLYWLITTIKLCILAIGGSFALHWWHSIASYLFIPAWNPDHKPYPLLIPGWTLSFEMFFYLAFAAALFVKKSPLPMLAILFTTLAILGTACSAFTWAPLTLLDQRLLEFVLGMGIGERMCSNRTLSPLIAWFALLVSSIVWWCTNYLPSPITEHYTLLIWGLPATCFLYAAISLEHHAFWRHRLLLQLGSASYAIYLTHEFAISGVKAVLTRLDFGGDMPLTLILLATVIIACALGCAVHKFLEKPMLSYFRQRFATTESM